jgi:competence protein ComEA
MVRFAISSLALLIVLAAHPFAQQASTTKSDAASKPVAIVNLNTATSAELETLPGIGAKTAARIIEYRTKKGPFRKIEELMNVQGVGEKSFLKLKAQLTVSPAPASASQQ